MKHDLRYLILSVLLAPISVFAAVYSPADVPNPKVYGQDYYVSMM